VIVAEDVSVIIAGDVFTVVAGDVMIVETYDGIGCFVFLNIMVTLNVNIKKKTIKRIINFSIVLI
jgi:hypothetical protein